MMPDRNTQFAGFAKALFDSLPWKDINIDMEEDGWEERWKTYIARRAYDLVLHVMSHLTELEPHRIILTDEEQQAFLVETLDAVPDLTHWPDEVHDDAS